jgi:GH35 family endo-1,4-beta-xylanase
MTLKDLYKDDFKIGVAIPNSLYASKAVTEEIAANFNSMTFENESKPDQILDIKGCQSGLPDTYTEPKVKFDSIKRGMEYAKENGIAVRFHTLLWYQQTPEGFFTEDYQKGSPKVSREVMLKRMESYIRQVMTYMEENYPGQIYCYDVVNEAIDPPHGDAAGMRKDSLWYEVIGPDFMNYAFEYARKYAPEGVDLYYNDYNCYSKSQQIIECLRPIKEAGNIDGIGMQSHISTTDNVDRQIRGTAAKFTAEGYKVQLTELDIGQATSGKNGEEVQAMKYAVLFKKMQQAKQNGTVDSDCITIWGLYDGISWRREETPLLYRFDGSKLVKKRAWYGAMQDPEIKAVEY